MTLDERFNLRGKVAVVVGGAGDLCSTIARSMAESGMEIVVLGVREPAADRATGWKPALLAAQRS